MFDLRALRYFLAVAQQGNITRAAEQLHLTQPTLSRQLQDLEEQLGVALFRRGKRHTELTAAGWQLKDRAYEILEMARRTQEDLSSKAEDPAGEIVIGCGETRAMRPLTAAFSQLQASYPKLRVRLISGDEDLVSEQLAAGILDFGVLCRTHPPSEHAYWQLPFQDRWGLILSATHPLAAQEGIAPGDLGEVPLIVSRQALSSYEIDHWLGRELGKLRISAVFNLIYNAVFLVEDGAGCLLSFGDLVSPLDLRARSLVFVPLKPELRSNNYLVLRKETTLSRAAQLLLDRVRNDSANYAQKA